MTEIKERPLSESLPFGARITGVNRDTLKDASVRDRIRHLFESRGVLVFEDMEPSGEMQVEVSNLFGDLQTHAMKAMPRVDEEMMPGVVDINYKANTYEIDGTILSGWVAWHFDACYSNKLNRGGVLRGIDLPPEGGTTGFADGIQMYGAISSDLRAKFENAKIVYHEKLMFMNQRFGKPKSYRMLNLSESAYKVLAAAETARRSIHPAVWTRKTGEKVLHVSPWQAAGLYGHEDAEGNALLEALCQEMYTKMTPYHHAWKTTDMVAWDNWRFLHSVSGHNPKYGRRMHRTTIKGDYGLGYFEGDAAA